MCDCENGTVREEEGWMLLVLKAIYGLLQTRCGKMDASEYKHVVLPLVFLKYISDSFEDLHAISCQR